MILNDVRVNAIVIDFDDDHHLMMMHHHGRNDIYHLEYMIHEQNHDTNHHLIVVGHHHHHHHLMIVNLVLVHLLVMVVGYEPYSHEWHDHPNRGYYTTPVQPISQVSVECII
jgi:hypothetical protein